MGFTCPDVGQVTPVSLGGGAGVCLASALGWGVTLAGPGKDKPVPGKGVPAGKEPNKAEGISNPIVCSPVFLARTPLLTSW